MFCDQCGMKIQEGDQFCPNCGNRVTQIPAPAAKQESAAAAGQMPMPVEGQTAVPAVSQASEKNRKGLVYAGIGVASLLLLALIAVGVFNLIVGKGGRLMMAIDATAKDAPLLIEDLRDAKKILTGDQFLAGFETEVDGGTLKGEFRNGKKDKQVYISVNNDEYNNLAVLFGVHSGVFRASAQGLDYAFFYDPKQDNEGFLTEDFREKELKRVNSLLEEITSDQTNAKVIQENVQAALKKEFKNLDIEKTAAQSWKVDGKKRKCKGYEVTLDEKNVLRFLEAFNESVQKELNDEAKDIVDDAMDIMIDEVKDMDFEGDFRFYIYKGKLAALVMETEYGEISVEFQGGDYRMQNIVMAYEDDYFSEELTISSERKGKTETTTIESDGEEITVVYDAKSGEVSIESEIYGDKYRIDGVYKHSASEVSYTLEDATENGSSMLDGETLTVYARKDPGIEKYEGEKFDLGNASEEDFEKLAEDMEEYIDAVSDLYW